MGCIQKNFKLAKKGDFIFKKFMPKKGKAKNTVNKAKHTKLMNRKINKVKLEKQRNKERLKAIIKGVNKQKKDLS